jgi:hypothetical protein
MIELTEGRWMKGWTLLALAVFTIPAMGCKRSEPQPEAMTPQQVRTQLREELRPVTLTNCTLGRFGSLNDGGYLLCENLIEKGSSTYSYGEGPEDDFSCHLLAQKGLPVHRYDCSASERPACSAGAFTNHNTCAGPKLETVEGRRFDTLEHQISENGDKTRRLILTMDVEGGEWSAFMATPDAEFEHIDQIAMEFHGVNEVGFLQVIRKLKRHFHLVNLNFNNYSCTPDAAPLPAWAYQVLFVNKRIGMAGGEPPAQRSELNAPDNQVMPDCQLLTEQDVARERSVREGLFLELQPVTLSNCTLARVGSANDGGYLMCANLVKNIAAAYSYGIGPNDDWGCAVSKRYKVTTHQYDCFDPARPVCEGGTFAFHNACIGDIKEQRLSRTFDTLANQIADNGDNGKHLLVKIDVEGAEWAALMATPDAVLDQIDQMALELHGVNSARYLATLRRLKEHFYVVNLNPNNQVCTSAAAPLSSLANQVLLVNKRIGVLDKRAPVPAPISPLNAVDTPAAAPCPSQAAR